MTPCPFCANPHPRLSRWWSGPFTYREVGRRTIRDYGRLLGWQIRCEPCGAVLRRESAGAGRLAMQTAKDALCAAWALRPAVDPPACPLCAHGAPQAAVGVDPDVQMPKGQEAIHMARCPGCGLTLCGARMAFDGEEYRGQRFDAMDAWSQRTAPGGFVSEYQRAVDASEAQFQEIIAAKRAKAREAWAKVRREGIRDRARGLRVHVEVVPVPPRPATGLRPGQFGVDFGARLRIRVERDE